MRRLAAHYVLMNREVYRMHYVELADEVFLGIYPLKEEIAKTAFFSGVLVLINGKLNFTPSSLFSYLHSLYFQNKSDDILTLFSCRKEFNVRSGEIVKVFHLAGLKLPTTEFCASDGCGNRYIERL
jgi:hypothetical protein